MAGLTPYLYFPGNAAEAMTFYRDTFGGELVLHSYAEFGRADGPADAVAHGILSGGPVTLYGADAAASEDAVHMVGADFALLGTTEPSTLHSWFEQLSIGGRVIDPLVRRAWGASDGRVTDRFGISWLLGYEDE